MDRWVGSGIVTLLTDFGTSSSYAGSLRGALLSVSRDLVLADITHEIPRFDFLSGALILRAAAPSFPPGTVHLAVVDPGVGSARRPVAVRSGDHVFVGPDNGLFTPFLGPDAAVFAIDADTWAPGTVSATFHGRDLFAPAAARIALGEDPARLGDPVPDPLRLAMPEPVIAEGGITGSVIHVDAFGNMVTNVSAALVGSCRTVRAGGAVVPVVRTYSDAPPGTLVALIGSGGLLEVAVVQGSAAERLDAGVGMPVVVFD